MAAYPDDHDNDAEENDANIDAFLQQAANTLYEGGFDSVQIIATRYVVAEDMSEGSTTLHTAGVGNHYSRQGAVINWLDIQDAVLSSSVTAATEEDDDDEPWKKGSR